MKNKILVLGAFAISLAYSQWTQSDTLFPSDGDQVKACKEKPEFLDRLLMAPVELNELPKAFWLARRAEYYVESIGENIQIHTAEDFVDPEPGLNSHVICGHANGQVRNYVIHGPMFIDLTKEHREGNSLWQFHSYIFAGQIGMENRASYIMSSSETLEELLQEVGGEYQFYQVSPKRYEMLIFKRDQGANQYLFITFDIVDKI